MDIKPLHEYPATFRRSWNRRRIVRMVIASLLFLGLFRTITLRVSEPWHSPPALAEADPELPDLQYLPLTGFLNDGKAGKRTCDELRQTGGIRVQESWYLDDDLLDIALSLQDHPLIDYSALDQDLTFEELVAKTWARLSGSSVWLPKYQVFLSVTRVIFYDKGVKHWPIMSFLRGQLYDEGWNELKNHTLTWHGDDIVFPTTFTIPAPYEKGAGFFGPEDPRIIIEPDVEDAEPVVVFNMLSDLKYLTRAMHIFRPFSNDTTILTINGQKERAAAEKNWAPFFHMDQDIEPGRERWPSHHIHFIHTFSPFTILKCHLLNGWCDIVYEQKTTAELSTPHDDGHGRMSGGTNLVPLPVASSPGVHAYVGFPRSHIDVGCDSLAMYRPEMMIMIAYGADFHLAFMSESLDFGDAAFTFEARDDPCGEGHILISNSIARWDTSLPQDELTLSFTVADSTVQILRVYGVYEFIMQLPYLQSALEHDLSEDGHTIWDMRWSAVGKDVLSCAMEAAGNYSEALAEPYGGKPRVEESPFEDSKVEELPQPDDSQDTKAVYEEQSEDVVQGDQHEWLNDEFVVVDDG